MFRRKLLASVATMVLPLGLFATTCFPSPPELSGSCQRVTSEVLDCKAEGYTGELVDSGLAAYSCTGEARPDHEATYIEGVPRGLLCAERGPLGDGLALGEGGGSAGLDPDATGYCCTQEPVNCAYDPVSDCQAPEYGYQCWGANRPESLNPAVSCSNGNREGEHSEYVNYCCTGENLPPACSLRDGVQCGSASLLGFECEGGVRPRGEHLGPNKSRADYFHPACTQAAVQPGNKDFRAYCCYMPALVPIGGTCVNQLNVPGCAPGRFGFACYGPDTAEDDYLPMDCDPGFTGTSAEGYPATLYCCDFKPEPLSPER